MDKQNGIVVSKMIVLFFLYLSAAYIKIEAKRVSMKVVDEPTNLGMNFQYQGAENPVSSALRMRVEPSNFSGPPHLRVLAGKCFTKIENEYKYELCPFFNLTQHEQSLRWNPYSGILGIWQEWEIENNTFVSMVMVEGDTCGEKFRQTKVYLQCGNKTTIGEVNEPETCSYSVILHTPLVCHPHSLLVYPTLTPELRQKWDLLEGMMANGEYTNQGYRKELRKIFAEAGLMLTEAEKLHIIPDELLINAEDREKEEITSLEMCREEYKKLQVEVEGLRALVELYKINSTEELGPERNWHYGDY